MKSPLPVGERVLIVLVGVAVYPSSLLLILLSLVVYPGQRRADSHAGSAKFGRASYGVAREAVASSGPVIYTCERLSTLQG